MIQYSISTSRLATVPFRPRILRGPITPRLFIKTLVRNSKIAAEPEDSPPPPPPQEQETKREPVDKPADSSLAKGQGTAIVTGAISLILGIGYLILVQLLDRGEMLPPPPEAFGP